MKLILGLLLLSSSSLAMAWQQGDLQENFSDIRAAQAYGQQQAEQSRLEAQQFQQQQQIQQMQQQQQLQQYQQFQDQHGTRRPRYFGQ